MRANKLPGMVLLVAEYVGSRLAIAWSRHVNSVHRFHQSAGAAAKNAACGLVLVEAADCTSLCGSGTDGQLCLLRRHAVDEGAMSEV